MSNGSRHRLSRGDRRRNEKLARLCAVITRESAVLAFDLAADKQVCALTDPDSKVLDNLNRIIGTLNDDDAAVGRFPMRADNTAHLITAAQRRHELTRAKAIQTLRELDQAGSRVTFETVARRAEVSRSWLYTQPDIKDQIQQLRALGDRTPNAPLPSRQRCSDRG